VLRNFLATVWQGAAVVKSLLSIFHATEAIDKIALWGLRQQHCHVLER
jgi:hypothetical protein